MTWASGTVRLWAAPLIIMLIAAMALGAALIMVDRMGEQIIESQAQAAILAERDYMAQLAKDEGMDTLIATVDRRDRVHGKVGMRYALSDPHGRPLAGARSLSSTTAGAVAGWKVVKRVDGRGHERWQVLATSLPSGENLLVAQDLGARRSFRQAIFKASWVALMIAAAAGVAVGLALSAIFLTRANAIARTTERIVEGQFHARAPATWAGGDVFDRIGRSVNVMLDRIEELMTGLRTVTDSLAHDLRTPLSRLQAALARAADAQADEAARNRALEQAQDHADEALATFSALLDIVQAEAGLSREIMEETDLGALAAGVVDLFGPVLEDAGQTLTFEPPGQPVVRRVHALLLRQALGNLLHNASRYAGEGARVRLALQVVAEGVRVVVADDGPGVPDHELGRVQQRFVRLDEARSTPGTGLGLAIVAACAKLHSGRLILQNNEPGLKAVLELAD